MLTPHWDKGTPFVAVVEQLKKQWSFVVDELTKKKNYIEIHFMHHFTEIS